MIGKLVALGIVALLLWFVVRPWLRPPVDMDVAEARRLLGVAEDADAEAIRAAHRRVIARVHPDAGGTEELARRINLARDLLLKAAGRGIQP